ncbi:DUF4139 domain-containing protein [Neogemmobacter tilapiae]|uniref:Mucoidy inhibitor MuiA family protein n=1 Tax=Neogemmobacter tilapiae TaxID=875041 RepID=A0A918WL22_9RHOB|nr:DUF4139 domain-containing protein [Gemmobacter tilapiae]GHC55385.1 hypothetical protein GCM10007315_17880 [Gemmobacter tilapiae]
MTLRPWLALFLMATFPAQAENFSATANITHVTLYPEGASVEREVTVDLPLGRHELLIADLPYALAANGLNLELPDNLGLVAQTIHVGALPAGLTVDRPDLSALDREIVQHQAALRAAYAEMAQIEARAEAARSKARALQSMLSGSELPKDAAELARVTDMVQHETLKALQTAKSDEAEIAEKRAALPRLQQALDAALAQRAAADERIEKRTTLALTLNSAGGKATLRLRNQTLYETGTGWQPKYEVFLKTGENPSLEFKRSAHISQSSGEDWQDVTLTLSTAEPTKQPSPQGPYVHRYTIAPIPTPSDESDAGNECDPGCGGPVVVADNPLLTAELKGQSLQYTFPEKVSIRNKTDSLVLALADLTIPAQNFVLVTDSYQTQAHLMAAFTNTTDQALLPGQALVYRDGVLMGEQGLDLVLQGQTGELGFGVLMDIVVKKDWPDRMAGSRGIFATQTERSEKMAISVENRSSRAWPLAVRVGIPQSEHEDLVITYTADPVETLHDKDGRPGLMEWQTDLPIGASYRVEYSYNMRWPQGMILQ